MSTVPEDPPKRTRANVRPGDRFGRLVFIEEIRVDGKFRMRAQCDCGNIATPPFYSVLRGHTKSCGCYGIESRGDVHRKHGHRHAPGRGCTPTYSTWMSMRSRCVRPDKHHAEFYQSRGIVVCDRWLNSFENFLADMGPRPPGMTLDRKENDGNYEPGNCRWSTMAEQCRNRRSNVWIEYKGERRVMTDWLAEFGLTASAFTYRLKKGWSIERIFSTPLRRRSKPSHKDIVG